jgi:hypothetical protein
MELQQDRKDCFASRGAYISKALSADTKVLKLISVV